MADKKINANGYAAITFDCYGTLIDGENGVLGYMQPLLQSYYINAIDQFVLGLFHQLEPVARDQWGSYREVLARVMQGFATRLAFTTTEETLNGLANSVQYWQPFPDTHDALVRLKPHFELGIISNIDEDLFSNSQLLLDIDFDVVVTASQVGAFKPDHAAFKEALSRADGPVLHVAQSHYHDIAPATELGIDTVCIKRPSVSPARPTQPEATWAFASMAEFADAIVS